MAPPTGKPRIGVVSDLRQIEVGAWRALQAALVPATYVRALHAAGGLPLVIPPLEADSDDVARVLEGLDGLLLIGGRDLDPALYGEERHPKTDAVDSLSRIRDQFERAVLDLALEAELPTLGVCRGVQLLNVALGGDLVQDLPGADEGGHQRAPGVFAAHRVEPLAGTAVAAAVGDDPVEVSSYHHQAIGRVASSLRVSARSEDGEIEALEDPARSFCVGVLWHPEERVPGEGLSLFEALVEAAAARGADRSDGPRRPTSPRA